MNSGSRVSLRSKLIGLTIATVLALGVLFAVVLGSEKSQLLSDRKEKLHNIVETAHGMFAHYEQLSRDGKMPVADAQQAALAMIRTLRINDHTPTTLAHGDKASLEGQNMGSLKDPNGKILFVEFVNTVKSEGAGFVDYYWPKPGSETPIEKLSYVQGFAPWGWIIGSGIYIDDVNAIFKQNALKFLAWGMLIGGFIAISLTLLWSPTKYANSLNVPDCRPRKLPEWLARFRTARATRWAAWKPALSKPARASNWPVRQGFRSTISAMAPCASWR